MADKQRSTEPHRLGEEEAKEPFTVDLGEEAVEEGVRQASWNSCAMPSRASQSMASPRRARRP